MPTDDRNLLMTEKKIFVFSAGCLAMAVSGGASAHHSHASLDRNSQMTKVGVVSEYLWKVPHVYLIVDVPDENGEVVQYTVETMNPPSLARLGWTADTFEPGDRIIWSGPHDRDPDRPYMGLDWAQRPDGPRMFADNRLLAGVPGGNRRRTAGRVGRQCRGPARPNRFRRASGRAPSALIGNRRKTCR